MNILCASALMSLLIVTTCAVGKEEKKGPVTYAIALKLGPHKLTEYTGGSEAGQNHAATLYATAKKLETEQALAKKDLESVVALNEWRDAITKIRQGAFGLIYIYNGGGTMFSHAGTRDAATAEDFLARLAKSLPLAEGKGSAEAVAKIDDYIKFIKTLDLNDVGADVATPEAKVHLAEESKRVIEHWESLKFQIQQIPADEAMMIVNFVADAFGWLRY